MKVILQEDVKSLGKKGTVVKVRDGFARNFLLPRGFALKATAANLETIDRKLKLQAQRIVSEKKEIQEFAKKLASISCTVAMDVHDEDKLFGSVTESHIVEALESENISLDKKQIILDEPIKALGIYDVKIKLHPEVTALLKVWVVKK